MFPPFETEKEEIALPPEIWMGVAALIISECLQSLFAQSLRTECVYRIDLWSGPIDSKEYVNTVARLCPCRQRAVS